MVIPLGGHASRKSCLMSASTQQLGIKSLHVTRVWLLLLPRRSR